MQAQRVCSWVEGMEGSVVYFCSCFVGFVLCILFQRKKTAKGKNVQGTQRNLEWDRQGRRGKER